MALRDNVHSRLVAWLKVLLPLGALAMLSTLFLFSHSIDPSKAVRYAKVDVKKLASEPQVTAPDYAGMTRDGTSVTVRAAVATPLMSPDAQTTPGSPAMQGVNATNLRVRFERKGGGATVVDAKTGSVDQGTGVMNLAGGVKINTSGGYQIDTLALTGLLDRTHLQSDGSVTATGPLGRIDAGGMVINAAKTAGSDAPGPYVLVFNRGVKLVYTPPEKGK